MHLAEIIPDVDTHTHTVVSGHAWSTLTENVNAAKQRGLKGLCVTEHGPDMPQGAPGYVPLSQTMLPVEYDGVKIFKGIEADINNFNGSIDINDKYLPYCEFVIASIHQPVLSGGTTEQNTAAYINALRNPYIDILGHPENPRVPCDLEAIIRVAAENNKLLEMNNNSLSAVRPGSLPYIIRYIELCKKMQARICVASDAHFHTMVGNVSPMMKLLDEHGYPPQLIVNLTIEGFEAYLSERKRRTSNIRG